jgi:hypothetical protein
MIPFSCPSFVECVSWMLRSSIVLEVLIDGSLRNAGNCRGVVVCRARMRRTRRRPPATRHRPRALSCAFVAQTAATEDNPLLGTRTLLVEESRYNPGPPPQGQTRTYEAASPGVKTTI